MIWILMALIGLPASADQIIYPKDAVPYLEKLDCSFSAFAVYTGKDVENMIGKLKSGQAYSNAICASSYAEGGAKKHDFCWLRVVDLKRGVYIGSASRGDAWRDESGPCSKESVLRILGKGSIKSQILFGANKEWRIVSDRYGVGTDFKNLFVAKSSDKGPLSRFKWKFNRTHENCIEEPDEADREYKVLVAMSVDAFKSEDKDKLTIGRRGESMSSLYYVSKQACENDQKRTSKATETDEDN